MREFLVTERLILRGLETADATETYLSWFDDAVICQGNNHHRYAMCLNDLVAYIESSQGSKSLFLMGIFDKQTHDHLGNIAISQIDYVNRTCVYSIIIGDKNAWFKGIGYEASYAVIKHVFDELNLNRISIGTLDTNVGMQQLALKLGAKQEGVKRAAIFKGGHYHDVYDYGLLVEEFRR